MPTKAFELTLEPLTEHQEQCDLMGKLLDNITTYPELAAVYAVPNGGFRHQAVARRMMQEGVKPGVPDLVFAQPRGIYSGYYQEQKRTVNSTVRAKQKAWHNWLRAQGYLVDVRKGAADGWNGFLAYLQMPERADSAWHLLSQKERLTLCCDLLPDWATMARERLRVRIAALP